MFKQKRWEKTHGFCLVIGMLLLGFIASAQAGFQVVYRDDSFVVEGRKQMDTKKPGQGVLKLSIAPQGSWKIDPRIGPADVDLTPGTGVDLKKTQWKKTDAMFKSNHRMVYNVPFKLKAQGEHKVEMAFRLVLCDGKLCQMKRFKIGYEL
jgi:hypothetical protein